MPGVHRFDKSWIEREFFAAHQAGHEKRRKNLVRGNDLTVDSSDGLEKCRVCGEVKQVRRPCLSVWCTNGERVDE